MRQSRNDRFQISDFRFQIVGLTSNQITKSSIHQFNDSTVKLINFSTTNQPINQKLEI